MIWKRAAILVSLASLIVSAIAVTTSSRSQVTPLAARTTSVSIEMLTREGCVNSPVMLRHLRKAIGITDAGVAMKVVDQSALLADDPRRGYATPTVLINGVDPFGQQEPIAPFPPPS
jgi:hypothetical protein